MKNPGAGSNALPERQKTRALYEKHLASYRAALQQLAQDVRLVLEQQGLTPAIKFRVKSFDAYYDKLRRLLAAKPHRRSLTIGDFFGLRIVCPFLEDIDKVSGLIAAHFAVLERESKASQHSFREFGYDSVHLAIRLDSQHAVRRLPGVRKVCEIQLRTILQDAWAEVEHELVYKSDISLPNRAIRRKLAALNATLTLSDLTFQEIRDYQKELRQHGRKRRAMVEWDGSGKAPAGISHPAAATQTPDFGPVPSTLTSRLEKIMLRALKAHSNHDLEEAVALYGQLLGMQLERKVRSLVYNHRGMAYFAMGSHPRALRDFSRAIDFNPDGDRGYANRGLCYRVMKKYRKALDDFNRALKINPDRPDHYFGRAQTYFDMQDYERAHQDCEKILALHSGFQPARELIRLIQRDLA